MKFKIEWNHPPIPLTKNKQKKLDFAISEISDMLDKASDLVFHTVLLLENNCIDGPLVVIYGSPTNDDTLFLTYYENPEWVHYRENM